MVRFWEEAASQFQSSTKSHSGASLKLHILLQPYIQSSAESIEKELARMMANLNEEIANLNEEIANLDEEIANISRRIRVVEKHTSAMKEVIKEMGETGKEEGEFKIIKEPLLDDRMVLGLSLRSKEHMRDHQFKFLGKIESREVIVFVGLLATHNFISKELVNALGIPKRRTQRRFRVYFGYDGSDSESEGAEVCEGVVLKTQDIEIVETFFVTDLAIADVVLGNEWLRSVGDTTYFQMGMPISIKFKWHGRTVKLEADPSLSRNHEVEIMSLDWI